MDDWEKINETSLPKKDELYSNLDIEEITDADYMHVKRACKDFEKKTQHFGEHHDFYLKSNTLLLVGLFR